MTLQATGRLHTDIVGYMAHIVAFRVVKTDNCAQWGRHRGRQGRKSGYNVVAD